MKSREPRKGPINASELLKQLQKNPSYVARSEKEQQRREQAREEYTETAGPLLKELAESGFKVAKVSDLILEKQYRTEAQFKQIIPILLRWLPKIDNVFVKEDIVRTLSVPWAKSIVAPVLIDEFRRSKRFPLKWAIGNALSIVADDTVASDLIELAQDKNHGQAREMLVVALSNIKFSNVIDVLIGLLDDEEVAGHAVMALGKLQALKAGPHIERFLTHSRAWIRSEAKKAIARIYRARQ